MKSFSNIPEQLATHNYAVKNNDREPEIFKMIFETTLVRLIKMADRAVLQVDKAVS